MSFIHVSKVMGLVKFWSNIGSQGHFLTLLSESLQRPYSSRMIFKNLNRLNNKCTSTLNEIQGRLPLESNCVYNGNI